MDDVQTMSRRQLLAAGTAVAAAAGFGGLGPLAGSAFGAERLVPKKKIGIQLFTVRTLAEADLPGTLALLADIGYREVEVAGLFGRTPAQFRALLDRYRLRASPGSAGRPGADPVFRRARGGRRARRGAGARATVCRDAGSRSRPASSKALANRRPQTATASSPTSPRVGAAGKPRDAALPARALLGVRARPVRGVAVPDPAGRDRPATGVVRAGLFWMVFGGIDPLPGSLATRTASRCSTSRTATPTRPAATSTPASRTSAKGRSTSGDLRGAQAQECAPLHRRARRPTQPSTYRARGLRVPAQSAGAQGRRSLARTIREQQRSRLVAAGAAGSTLRTKKAPLFARLSCSARPRGFEPLTFGSVG